MVNYLYAFIIYPIEMFIETVFTVSLKLIPSPGYAVIFVSLAVQILVLPLYKRADKMQEQERLRQADMAPVVMHLKRTFRGDERVMMLSTYYRVEGYHQYYQLRTILPLLLQIPFFIAAYHFLSNCKALDGAAFYFMKDMGRPDGMLSVGGMTINVLPVLMTVINIISGMIYSNGLGVKEKLQLYITAGIFLVLLYNSPSGLVFYWTLNNIFSLGKNVFMKLMKHYKYSFGALCGTAKRTTPKTSRTEMVIFCIFSLTSAIVWGLMIPSATMKTSPTEFVIRGHYVNPTVHVLYTFTIALGIFFLWVNLFYFLSSVMLRRILSYIIPAFTICNIVNYLFFSDNLSNLSMNMYYYDVFSYEQREKIINLICLIVICIIVFVLCVFFKRIVAFMATVVIATVLTWSCYNIYFLNDTINHTEHIKDDGYYTNSDAHFTLDRNGKNVIILMLDRAFGQYLPYIMNEKPELLDAYSGFTYYRNTISHGMQTAIGAPGLFGGYEYTPYELKDGNTDRRNEALKVMPKLFSQRGFECTVFDPPYFIDLGEGSLEDYYHEIDPSITAYYADRVMKTKEEADRDYRYFEHAARVNFIRHSIFITSPLFIRMFLYDDTAYLMQERIDDRIIYAGHIEELEKLSDMTRISDDGVNTFTIIENDTPHSQDVVLQLPDYTYVEEADNSKYYYEWESKLGEVSDRQINMYSDSNKTSYQVNMAALLTVAKWMDYLKKNDLYENTRLIIAADHGYFFYAFDDMLYDMDGVYTDLDMFVPLLMVKDFGDGTFNTSDEFMTNADVPTLAMAGIIDDPINPYTGNKINSSKKNGDQYVLDNSDGSVGDLWFTVHDNVYDINNWKFEGRE